MRPECSDPVNAARIRALGVVATRSLLMGAVLIAGCQAPPGDQRGAVRTTQSAGGVPITNTDACATRLHDICGPLLLYFAANHRLPERIEELADVQGFEGVRDFTCPVSRQPYIYKPEGIINPDTSRVILYDPVPCHSGLRWGLSIAEPAINAPLIAKVIAVPEARLMIQGTRPAK